ncbi:hypothetical protein CR513_43950, partial [Mucuna pruriens]
MRANLDLLQEVREVAHVKEYVAKARVGRRYNAKGDLILKRTLKDGVTNKLTPNWEGPYIITKEVGKRAFRLEHLDGKKVLRARNECIIVKNSTSIHYNVEIQGSRPTTLKTCERQSPNVILRSKLKTCEKRSTKVIPR